MLVLDREFAAMSEAEVAMYLIDDLKQEFGCDLGRILLSPALAPTAKKRLAIATLMEGILAKAEQGGYLAGWNEASADLAGEDAFLARVLSSDVDIEPNISIIPADLPTIRAYRGRDIKEYLFTLAKRFEAASKGKTAGQVAVELVAGGAISVGVPFAILAIKSYRAGSTILAAARAGITGLGMKTALTFIAAIVVTLLLFLLLENPKKVLGMVINDTDEDMIVKDWRDGLDGADKGDLYMAHGSMKSFMLDHTEGLSSPEVQIRKRIFFEEGDPENFAFGGIYFADKSFGLRGAEGVFALKAQTSGKRIAVLFACPYDNDNGTNMDVIGEVKPESVFRSLYDARKTTMSRTKDGYKLESSVNDNRGGTVGCISYIGKA